MSFFEFDDVKRLHVGYQDPIYKSPYWMASGSNGPLNNWLRGFFAGTLATFAVNLTQYLTSTQIQPLVHFYDYTHLMLQKYQWPTTYAEKNIFFKELFRIKGIWKELIKKINFGLFTVAGDLAPRFAFFHIIYGGTQSPAQVADWNIYKHFICANLSALGTCWLAGPFDVAHRAYIADKTWPIDLQKGYRSPIHAMLTIPFKQGPWYLFRGTLPLMTYSYFMQVGFFTVYTFLKNKFFFLWVHNDFNYNYIKTLFMSFSFAVGVMGAYPAYYAMHMVDNWPKERGGRDTFNGSYSKAIKWELNNMERVYTNFFPKFWRSMMRHGFPFLFMAWWVDKMGLLNPAIHMLNGNEMYWHTTLTDV